MRVSVDVKDEPDIPACPSKFILIVAAEAQAGSQKVASVRLMLEALGEKGGARPGRRNATLFAIRAFKKINGLEQLAACSLNGNPRRAMRPASSG